MDSFFVKDIRDFDEKDIVDSEKKIIWTLASVPCPKPFDGRLLFPKGNKSVQELFDEGVQRCKEIRKQMEEEQQQ